MGYRKAPGACGTCRSERQIGCDNRTPTCATRVTPSRTAWAPGSDLDVFIVLSSAGRPVRERIPDFLPGAFPLGLDLFPYTREEMADQAPSPLLEAVHRSQWRYGRGAPAAGR